MYAYSPKPAILARCLLVVAALAQGLMVQLVPKEIVIATVWANMIDNCGRPAAFATGTIRSFAEEPGPVTLPAGAVAALAGRGSLVFGFEAFGVMGFDALWHPQVYASLR
jgi:hypothetical protein